MGVPNGQVCQYNELCCHTEAPVVNQTCHLNHQQCTDTRPTSPGTDSITPVPGRGAKDGEMEKRICDKKRRQKKKKTKISRTKMVKSGREEEKEEENEEEKKKKKDAKENEAKPNHEKTEANEEKKRKPKIRGKKKQTCTQWEFQ